jgi:hypothetical protein
MGIEGSIISQMSISQLLSATHSSGTMGAPRFEVDYRPPIWQPADFVPLPMKCIDAETTRCTVSLWNSAGAMAC